jgi:hypothetical protein
MRLTDISNFVQKLDHDHNIYHGHNIYTTSLIFFEIFYHLFYLKYLFKKCKILSQSQTTLNGTTNHKK